jgi:hypothetical protein
LVGGGFASQNPLKERECSDQKALVCVCVGMTIAFLCGVCVCLRHVLWLLWVCSSHFLQGGFLFEGPFLF